MANQSLALEVVKNSYYFNDANTQNKSRLEIFQGIVPRTKGVRDYEFVSSKSNPQEEIVNPLLSPFIPSEEDLHRWTVELKNGGTATSKSAKRVQTGDSSTAQTGGEHR